MITRGDVWAALSEVRDPELDRPITDLGFVAAVTIGDRIRVELRLPTYFCAPNFAWLMVADARDAVAALPGAGRPDVVLLEHFVSAEINEGVAAVSDFGASFDADGFDPDLASLRAVFERKAHLAAQERLARALRAAGVPADLLPTVRLSEAAALAREAAEAVARRRERAGIRSELAFCDDEGRTLTAATMPGWLRFAQTVRVSIDGNAGFCRGLLETRYGLARAAPT